MKLLSLSLLLSSLSFRQFDMIQIFEDMITKLKRERGGDKPKNLSKRKKERERKKKNKRERIDGKQPK